MRDRPFLLASEQPRPFSETRAERDAMDLECRRRARQLDDIAALEAQAEAAADPATRKRLQCEAEALRCALAERASLQRPL